MADASSTFPTSRLEDLESRVARIEDILTRLEGALYYGPFRNRYARPGGGYIPRHLHQSPFEGMQDFPANVAKAVEAALMEGTVENMWCERHQRYCDLTFKSGTWKCTKL